jgi:hypothetical protein
VPLYKVQLVQPYAPILFGKAKVVKTTVNSLPPPEPTNTECLEIQGTTYTATTGTKVDAICGTNWSGNDLYLTFTLDFFSCIDGCAGWNSNNTEKCIGVAWVSGHYGPDGLSGGCQCYYKWDMPGAGAPYNIVSSAKLINVTQNSPVESKLNLADILDKPKEQHNFSLLCNAIINFDSIIDFDFIINFDSIIPIEY